MLNRFFPAGLFCLSLAAAAFADDNCKDPRSAYDRTYCAAKLFLESDKELNDVYKELKALLKPDVQKKLTQVQRDWIKYRDGQCEEGGAIDVDCNHKVNVARIDYLRERLREAKAGQARPDLIEKPSW
jgi:uncharacterized protein YecT (DUF1311 family)